MRAVWSTMPIGAIKLIYPLENVVFSSNPIGFTNFGGSGEDERFDHRPARDGRHGRGRLRRCFDEKGGDASAAVPAGATARSCRSSPTRPRRSSTTRSSRRSRRPPPARASVQDVLRRLRRPESRAVEAGQQADVVTFSTEPDMTRLVDAGLVTATGTRRPPRASSRPRSSPSSSARATRRTSRPGTTCSSRASRSSRRTRSPRARPSGTCSRRYGDASDGGKNPQAGLDYLTKLITDHVEVQDKSGREALQTFIGGNGDVLLSYEYEAITAQKKGEKVDYVSPGRHDQDQHRHREDRRTRRPQAADVPRLRRSPSPPSSSSPTGATARSTRRSSTATRTKFPTPPGLFTIDDLGGWTKVNDELFDLDNGSIAKIEEDAGVSTAEVSARVSSHSPARRPAGRPGALGAGRSRRCGSASSSCCRWPPSSRRSTDGGLGAFWDAITSRQAVAALELHADGVAGRRGRSTRSPAR